MDIFEEIKEAVLASTPGEDTRNFYRNQGVQLERDRIITMLEATITNWRIADLHQQADLLDHAIALIKGEK